MLCALLLECGRKAGIGFFVCMDRQFFNRLTSRLTGSLNRNAVACVRSCDGQLRIERAVNRLAGLSSEVQGVFMFGSSAKHLLGKVPGPLNGGKKKSAMRLGPG